MPSRHEDDWDYGGAASAGRRPGPSVLRRESGTSGTSSPALSKHETPETRTENGVARMPGGGEAAWFKDSEGNLVGVVPA